MDLVRLCTLESGTWWPLRESEFKWLKGEMPAQNQNMEGLM